MFEVGFLEMAFLGVIGLIVIGPKRLPTVARTVGLWVSKAHRILDEVKSDIKREMNQYESLHEITSIKHKLKKSTKEVNNGIKKKDDNLCSVTQKKESKNASIKDDYKGFSKKS